jgi:transcription-repair coupling factor (superfamily II helicase)
VLTTVNAIVQRVPAREIIAAQALSVAPGHVVPMDSIVSWLEHNGYNRSSTVREPGEYAVRGGILDLFPAGLEQPVRFDFFGDTLESIRTFDAETQRTLLDMRALDLVPISEFQLVTETIRRFRMGYVAAFGAPERDDLLYEAVSEGRRHPGMEHWLPLFAERMDTLFDYLGDARSRSSRRARTPRASASGRYRIITRPGARRWNIPAAARSTSRCRRTGSI